MFSNNNSRVTGWDAELVISYNIFDAGILRRDITIEQQEGYKNIDSSLAALLQIRNDIKNTITDAKTQKDIIGVTRVLIGSAKRNVDQVTRQYRAGTLKYLDLINAINTLSGSKKSFLNARYQLATDYYNYFFHKGTIYHHVFKNH